MALILHTLYNTNRSIPVSWLNLPPILAYPEYDHPKQEKGGHHGHKKWLKGPYAIVLTEWTNSVWEDGAAYLAKGRYATLREFMSERYRRNRHTRTDLPIAPPVILTGRVATRTFIMIG